jgi:hypothetical protein
MRVALFLAGAMVLGTVAARPLQGQDESRLRKALEGKRITLKMDMPATSEGVDVYPGSGRPVDYDKVGKRMKKEGVAIRDGEAARITRVKVKDNLIEVQLNGGGYGTFGDGLGSLLKNQAADSGAAQQMKYQNQRTEKLAAGSRFNLRYPNGVDSDALTPAAVIQALEEYATFPPGIATVATNASYSSTAAGNASSTPATTPAQIRKGMSADDVAGLAGAPTSSKTTGPITTNRHGGATGTMEVDFVNDIAVDVRQLPAAAKGNLRKGLSIEEVEQLAGKPISSSTKNQMLTNRYHWQDGILEADFFNGVLVAYRTSSR